MSDRPAARNPVPGEKPAAAAPPARPAVEPPSAPPGKTLPRLALFLVAGLAGGAAAWVMIARAAPAVIERNIAFYQIPPALAARSGELAGGNSELASQTSRAELVVTYRKTATHLGLAGLAVAAVVGLAAGIARRSFAAAAIGLLVGALAGALLGVVGGLGEVWVGESVWPVARRVIGSDATFQAIAMHAVGWIFIGLAGALAVYAASRRSVSMPRVAGHAGAAALIGSALYAVLAGLLFPMDRADLVIPAGDGNALVWAMLFAVLIALAVGRGSVPRAAVPAAGAARGASA